MERQFFTGLFLLCLWQTSLQADEIPDIFLRHHAQWVVGTREQQTLLEKYGLSRVSFDEKGQAMPHGLSPKQMTRWKRLYELCMRDGCTYCDAEDGSCETGTCGPQNAHCKPYLGSEGRPKCGAECADYAFMSTLI